MSKNWDDLEKDGAFELPKTGQFSWPNQVEVYGELKIRGKDTNLYLQQSKSLDLPDCAMVAIYGVLNDLTKVTLIDCALPPGPNFTSRKGGSYYSANVFPHFIVYGDVQLDPIANSIRSISFSIDDGNSIFYDFDAFGIVTSPELFIDALVSSHTHGRKIEVGPRPLIQYFTGKNRIIAVQTIIGEVSVDHGPSYTIGGPKGVRIDNRIVVTITPNDPITFKEAIERALTLLRFFAILAGRPQNISNIVLTVSDAGEERNRLRVYWSSPPTRKDRDCGKAHAADILIDAVRNGDEFSSVMALWLDLDQCRFDSRNRFHSCFAKQSLYDVDRLIGAANMFDILPSSAFPPEPPIPPHMQAAQNTCQKIFRKLPDSTDRSAILSALGRIGGTSLKKKIHHRVALIVKALPSKFPDIEFVSSQAVDCRNHYVHGTEAKLNYNAHFDAVVFLTNCLEFSFAISDLIEAGWDTKAWAVSPSALTHPLTRFMASYLRELAHFKALLKVP